ncbi:Drug/metabolite transporter [Penicillium brevicompactum]|uniref:Drug/metabolite transporter n=1 Tax=Penicillium brevicompactum TaxID=5074 RepID=A0A9W9QSD6_PENBR|nr:Drug/metabolite transporter [Penicillium brevicompactum]
MSYSKIDEQEEAELALLSSDSGSVTGSDDLEANHKVEQSTPTTTEPEYQTPTSVKFMWLGSYFFFSMMLTLYNKLILGSFKFPWLLTCMHTTFASIGTLVLLKLGRFKLSRLGRKEHLILVAFSVLFTANIAMSNLSLSLVSLAFFQIIRNTVPIFTVLIYRGWFGRSYQMATYLSLCPIIIGAGMTVVGEYRYSALGLFITVFGVVLAAVKTVTTNRLMTGSLALPSMELLFRMSPLAAIQSFVFALLAGEIPEFANTMSQRAAESSKLATMATVAFLLGNGLLAFFLNVSSFQTNKLAGALTISVCGNLKQALTLAIGIFIFKDFTVDLLNGTGILLVLAGCAFFSKAELDSKKKTVT